MKKCISPAIIAVALLLLTSCGIELTPQERADVIQETWPNVVTYINPEIGGAIIGIDTTTNVMYGYHFNWTFSKKPTNIYRLTESE